MKFIKKKGRTTFQVEDPVFSFCQGKRDAIKQKAHKRTKRPTTTTTTIIEDVWRQRQARSYFLVCRMRLLTQNGLQFWKVMYFKVIEFPPYEYCINGSLLFYCQILFHGMHTLPCFHSLLDRQVEKTVVIISVQSYAYISVGKHVEVEWLSPKIRSLIIEEIDKLFSKVISCTFQPELCENCSSTSSPPIFSVLAILIGVWELFVSLLGSEDSLPILDKYQIFCWCGTCHSLSNAFQGAETCNTDKLTFIFFLSNFIPPPLFVNL